MITSVWSSFGHTFLSGDDCDEDDPSRGHYVSCLSCGAEYILRPDPADPTRGNYVTNNGDDAQECTRDTSMQHGDRHDSGHELDCPGGCEHCAHDCNCVICTG